MRPTSTCSHLCLVTIRLGDERYRIILEKDRTTCVSYQYALYAKRGHIAYVTLNRPEVMNALHHEANVELGEIFHDFSTDDDAWIAIVTGAGERAFSAGNDLKATAARTASGERPSA